MDSGGCYHASIDCAVDVYGSDVGGSNLSSGIST